ncbi:endonuclease/exonuclease/phosphatase family metal-dependent hydrolase [Thermocatellispora tengchongensis]|uniref:Endonuclease/exonuclease/phosphatase family metal-dependent hydrolase n=1 Tax=Thermocatellispora tengchongensis TaxID=1073253 RepID=A0A840PKU0_9ACTN|nr:endonuclease/exonuclease/phosphatase family protein [Thermocatellispora tengchongensis]MBB5139712.1 endonuclease/exonuclease/phosphatase family metal-dependent hydrolase [Thermocatellispora tengchongensis]
MAVRVATYNVRSMYDSVPALTRVIRGLRADVLCVQEAPRFLCWRRKRRALARAAGMTVAAGGRRGGVAVFAGPRARVLHAENHLLRFYFRLERRAVAVAVVEVEGVRLAVGSIHLDLDEAARFHHAGEAVELVERIAARHGAAAVLAGDVNEQEDRESFGYIAGRLADCYRHAPSPGGDGMTFTARSPGKRIDAIFAGPGLAVVACGGSDASREDLAAATDHLPVIAELVAC